MCDELVFGVKKDRSTEINLFELGNLCLLKKKK